MSAGCDGPHLTRRPSSPWPLPSAAVDLLPGGWGDKVRTFLGPTADQAVLGLQQGADLIESDILPVINDTVLPVSGDWLLRQRCRWLDWCLRVCCTAAACSCLLGVVGQRWVGPFPATPYTPTNLLAPVHGAGAQQRLLQPGLVASDPRQVALHHHCRRAGPGLAGPCLGGQAECGGQCQRRQPHFPTHPTTPLRSALWPAHPVCRRCGRRLLHHATWAHRHLPGGLPLGPHRCGHVCGTG